MQVRHGTISVTTENEFRGMISPLLMLICDHDPSRHRVENSSSRREKSERQFQNRIVFWFYFSCGKEVQKSSTKTFRKIYFETTTYVAFNASSSQQNEPYLFSLNLLVIPNEDSKFSLYLLSLKGKRNLHPKRPTADSPSGTKQFFLSKQS